MIGPNKFGFQWENWDLKTGYKPMQWRPIVSAPLCAFCNKAVYPAEEVFGAGQKFHKFCLKCTTCNTLLNSGNLNEHDKKIYCITCYRRQFGPRGGTISSFNVYTPPSTPHLNNNHCYERKVSIGSSSSRTSSDDDSRHSNSYIHKITYSNGTKLQQINSRASSTIKRITLSGNICPRCSKIVYLAEEIKAVGKSFHKRCYNCAHCKGNINGGRYSEHNGELYDNNCYQRLFGPKGILTITN